MDGLDCTAFPAKTIARFWSKVDKSAGPDGCWPWTACRDRDGYGLYNASARLRKAHRVAYVVSCGPIPSGLVVMHSCDNPPCCNPAHLGIGTPGDNARDAVAKGRASVGAANGAARLTAAMVERIRRDHAAGVTRLELADRFGVCRRQINDIVTGRSWAHVGGPIAPRIKTVVDASMARAIRAAYARGDLQADIASAFGVSAPCVSNIVTGRTWPAAGGPITRGGHGRSGWYTRRTAPPHDDGRDEDGREPEGGVDVRTR